MVGAAIAVGAATVGSAAISASGAESAANTQAGADSAASAQQMAMFNTINGQEQPFMSAGVSATNSLSQLLGLTPGGSGNGYLSQAGPAPFSFNPSSITSSPGYQFSQSQGLQQTQNAIAPNVGALSGPALQALTNYATGNAEQYYNNYYNQALGAYTTNFNTQQTAQNNIFSRLSGIAGLGQNAASNVGTAGTQLGTGAAQATAAGGAAQAAGTVGAANAAGAGISGAGNAFALNSILSANQGGSAIQGSATPAGLTAEDAGF